MKEGYFVGCITGTSVDGLDIALVHLSKDALSIEQSTTVAIPDNLRARLLKLGQAEQLTLEEVGQCDALLGTFIGDSIGTILKTWEKIPSEIVAIGSHGQTIRHRPDPQPGIPAFTQQIGDPSRIAEQTNITTVADFRRRDIAAGGQGAPLVPPFHRALFNQHGQTSVIVNIGGISNVSILAPDVSGFDTGPGNALMDAWCLRHKNLAFDEDGAWAAAGRVNAELLEKLLADPYFNRPPPKSTGREYFNLDWLDRQLDNSIPTADVQTTLCELTAVTIINALKDIDVNPDQLIIVGGGRLNGHLMQRLSGLAKCSVLSSEDVDADGDGIEAAAFAWLAAQTLWGLPGNAPLVTGSLGPRILGAIYPA